jgi:hypothetical protein
MKRQIQKVPIKSYMQTCQANGGFMKKAIIISMIMVLTFLLWSLFAPAQSQDPVNEEKPTFYRSIPGVYVNGWPRFTVTYPKDWVERPSLTFGGQVFCVSPPGPAGPPTLMVHVGAVPYPLDKFADSMVPLFKTLGATEVIVVSDKPSQLHDGTPAREVEYQMVSNENGLPVNSCSVATKKDDTGIVITVTSSEGKIGEDLKAILYSFQFEPGKDEPVKVPPDVQEFFDSFCNAWVAHDLKEIMAHYSDRYLQSGTRKGEMERFWRQFIGPMTSFEVGITEFVSSGDKAYLTGFAISNLGKFPLGGTSIIKENGDWKWYGDQRNPAP